VTRKHVGKFRRFTGNRTVRVTLTIVTGLGLLGFMIFMHAWGATAPSFIAALTSVITGGIVMHTEEIR
jgi:hypothetical protein